MADKIIKPSIENILKILDKRTSSIERNYIARSKTKYLAISAKDFIGLKPEQRKNFVFNVISSKTTLSPFQVEFVLVLVEILSTKLSTIYVLDDIIDLLVNYTKIKIENDKVFNKLVNLIDLENGNSENKYTIEEMKALMTEFVNSTNEKYLFKQTDNLNYQIKYEYENDFAKRIDNYRNKYEEYKLKYETLLLKTKQIAPNFSFQNKVKRKYRELEKSIYQLKRSLYWKQYGKSYGICVRLVKKIQRNIDAMQGKKGVEQMFAFDKLKLQQKQNSQIIQELIPKLDELEKKIFSTLDKQSTEMITKRMSNENLSLDNKLLLLKQMIKEFSPLGIEKNFLDENQDDLNNTIDNKQEDLEENI